MPSVFPQALSFTVTRFGGRIRQFIARQRDSNKWTEGISGPGQTQTTNKWLNRTFSLTFASKAIFFYDALLEAKLKVFAFTGECYLHFTYTFTERVDTGERRKYDLCKQKENWTCP